MRKSIGFFAVLMMVMAGALPADDGDKAADRAALLGDLDLSKPTTVIPSERLGRRQLESPGEVFFDYLRALGFDEEEVLAIERHQRNAAIRAVYEEGDETVIAHVEATVPADVIASALMVTDRQPEIKSLQNRTVYLNCAAGHGATGQFRAYGHWWAYFETTTGARTSVQEGDCWDFMNGCTVTDTIGGNPAISWRLHNSDSTQQFWHIGWCN